MSLSVGSERADETLLCRIGQVVSASDVDDLFSRTDLTTESEYIYGRTVSTLRNCCFGVQSIDFREYLQRLLGYKLFRIKTVSYT